MQLSKQSSADSEEFKYAWGIMEQAFPADERRDVSQQIHLLQNPNYSFLAALQDRNVVGLVGLWEFSDFSFVEHFAIRDGIRGNGLGTAMLGECLKSSTTFVLEVERPETGEMAKRRIRFYERLGFKLNSFSYIQPAYGPGKNPVPMFLMSYPKSLSAHMFNEVRRDLHTQVYGLRVPII